jgi:hypothetical protein
MSNESKRETEEALARQRRESEEREAQALRREREERQRELEEIPPTPIDKTKWPEGVRSLSLDEDALGVDAKGNLYWVSSRWNWGPLNSAGPMNSKR